MEPRNPAPCEFSLLQFSLETAPDGRRTQRVRNVGRFTSIEAAFVAARLHAWQAFRALTNQTEGELTAPHARAELRDTEWGYDLRVDALTVTRFWVHDGKAADALAV
jgi:hypothetical protein